LTLSHSIDKDRNAMNTENARPLRMAASGPTTGLTDNSIRDISKALNTLLADVFALYLKTKNFHWHVAGPNFREYHLLFDDQASQLFAVTDAIAERVRKVGGTTLRSIGHNDQLKRIGDNDSNHVSAADMLTELHEDNRNLVVHMREAHGVCGKHGDVASTSLIEGWIDEAEQRIWFLFETSRTGQ
jgi:starvation-inducible DNA-binding protein